MGGRTYPPALPKWEGGLMSDGFVEFPKQCPFSRSKGLSPFGETGEGFCVSVRRVIDAYLVLDSKVPNLAQGLLCL